LIKYHAQAATQGAGIETGWVATVSPGRISMRMISTKDMDD
jgi:hypothetical protein